jgi:hypothetical protein
MDEVKSKSESKEYKINENMRYRNKIKRIIQTGKVQISIDL